MIERRCRTRVPGSRMLVLLALASCDFVSTRTRADGGAAGGSTGGGAGFNIGGGIGFNLGGGFGFGGGIVLPQLPPVPNLLVFGAGATKLLADVSNARVEIDPTHSDALTALGECADLLAYCYAPPTLTLSTCFDTVRPCATSTPWTERACCPVECKDAFRREVNAGLGPAQALEKVLFLEPDCFPGVRAALEAP